MESWISPSSPTPRPSRGSSRSTGPRSGQVGVQSIRTLAPSPVGPSGVSQSPVLGPPPAHWARVSSLPSHRWVCRVSPTDPSPSRGPVPRSVRPDTSCECDTGDSRVRRPTHPRPAAEHRGTGRVVVKGAGPEPGSPLYPRASAPNRTGVWTVLRRNTDDQGDARCLGGADRRGPGDWGPVELSRSEASSSIVLRGPFHRLGVRVGSGPGG